MNCPVLVHHFPVFGRTVTRHHLRTAQNVHTRAEFQKKKKKKSITSFAWLSKAGHFQMIESTVHVLARNSK